MVNIKNQTSRNIIFYFLYDKFTHLKNKSFILQIYKKIQSNQNGMPSNYGSIGYWFIDDLTEIWGTYREFYLKT